MTGNAKASGLIGYSGAFALVDAVHAHVLLAQELLPKGGQAELLAALFRHARVATVDVPAGSALLLPAFQLTAAPGSVSEALASGADPLPADVHQHVLSYLGAGHPPRDKSLAIGILAEGNRRRIKIGSRYDQELLAVSKEPNAPFARRRILALYQHRLPSQLRPCTSE